MKSALRSSFRRLPFMLGLVLISAGNLVLACGSRQKPDDDTDNGFEDVVVNIESADTSVRSSLTLAPPSQFSGEIKGCASGYSLPVTEATAGIKVQKDDLNCFFRLTSLTSSGETFDFSAIADGSFAKGSKFNVVGRSGTLAEFQIAAQLTSPVAGLQTVVILFGSSAKGATERPSPGVNAGITLAGSDDIQLETLVLDTSVSSKPESLGFGLFTFDLGCTSSAGAVSESGVLKCGGISLADLKFGLTQDTSAGKDIGLEACKAIAAQPGNTGTPFPADSVGFPKGGLRTTSLLGSGRLYDPAHKNLVFAIASSGQSAGCRYFRIEVAAP